MTEPVLCHCGKPLHYKDPLIELAITRLVEMLGEYVPILTDDGRTWKVPRHYIALHGVRASELSSLGFEEIQL